MAKLIRYIFFGAITVIILITALVALIWTKSKGAKLEQKPKKVDETPQRDDESEETDDESEESEIDAQEEIIQKEEPMNLKVVEAELLKEFEEAIQKKLINEVDIIEFVKKAGGDKKIAKSRITGFIFANSQQQAKTPEPVQEQTVQDNEKILKDLKLQFSFAIKDYIISPEKIESILVKAGGNKEQAEENINKVIQDEYVEKLHKIFGGSKDEIRKKLQDQKNNYKIVEKNMQLDKTIDKFEKTWKKDGEFPADGRDIIVSVINRNDLNEGNKEDVLSLKFHKNFKHHDINTIIEAYVTADKTLDGAQNILFDIDAETTQEEKKQEQQSDVEPHPEFSPIYGELSALQDDDTQRNEINNMIINDKSPETIQNFLSFLFEQYRVANADNVDEVVSMLANTLYHFNDIKWDPDKHIKAALQAYHEDYQKYNFTDFVLKIRGFKLKQPYQHYEILMDRNTIYSEKEIQRVVHGELILLRCSVAEEWLQGGSYFDQYLIGNIDRLIKYNYTIGDIYAPQNEKQREKLVADLSKQVKSFWNQYATDNLEYIKFFVDETKAIWDSRFSIEAISKRIKENDPFKSKMEQVFWNLEHPFNLQELIQFEDYMLQAIMNCNIVKYLVLLDGPKAQELGEEYSILNNQNYLTVKEKSLAQLKQMLPKLVSSDKLLKFMPKVTCIYADTDYSKLSTYQEVMTFAGFETFIEIVKVYQEYYEQNKDKSLIPAEHSNPLLVLKTGFDNMIKSYPNQKEMQSLVSEFAKIQQFYDEVIKRDKVKKKQIGNMPGAKF